MNGKCDWCKIPLETFIDKDIPNLSIERAFIGIPYKRTFKLCPTCEEEIVNKLDV